MGGRRDWIDSAAAAELWALYTVLRTSVGVPTVVTHCQGILSSSDTGTGPATRAMIAAELDGDINQITRDRKVVWLPANQPASRNGVAQTWDGILPTAREWRDNQLFDGLSKTAARRGAARNSMINQLSSAHALVTFSAA